MIQQAVRCGIVMLFVLPAFCRGQAFDWKIVLNDGEEFSRLSLQRFANDSLYCSRSGKNTIIIAIDSIIELRRERNSAILPSAIVGAVGGGLLGYSIKPASVNESEANVYGGVFGAVLGGFGGYFFGSLIQRDDVFDFSSLSSSEKRSTATRLLEQANLK